MAIRAGRLNKRITIQKLSAANDDFGSAPPQWETFATAWASVEPLQGREFMSTSGEQAQVTTRIRLRYIPGITSAMRVLSEGRVFNLAGPPVDPDMRHRELHLMTVETDETP